MSRRLFSGIAVDVEGVAPLLEAVEKLRAGHPGLRWSERSGWHVTLQFYGVVNEEQERTLREHLQVVRAGALEVVVRGMGTFDRAGVLFAGVEKSAKLEELRRKVVEAGSASGFEAEERAFRPHITLARRKGRGARGEFPRGREIDTRLRLGAFRAAEFVLYESVTGPGGSRYEVLERYGLRG